MRAAQMYEQDEIAGEGAELNLGMSSLIGIFFGLALVCGIFFGFGYMMGHRSPGPYVSTEPLYTSPAPKAAAVVHKPSAQVSEQPEDAQRVIVPSSALPEAAGGTSSASPAASAANGNSHVRAVIATPPPAAAARSAAEPSGTIMVQIAAVKNRPDAEALASALRRNGFNPSVRTEAQDKLLHVQLGPFDNRDEAKAMRQKLSNAGYNAFVK